MNEKEACLSNEFHFIINKNKYIWQNKEIKIEFSNPTIETSHESQKIDDIEQILYYYYFVKIYYLHTAGYDENDNEIKKWKLLTSKYIYDFPAIVSLKYILNQILTNPDLETYQKDKCSDNSLLYTKHYDTSGFMNEDVYTITHYLNKDEEFEKYVFYFGCAIDNECDKNTIGINIEIKDKKEIIELFNCINSFILYSIDKYNKETDLMLKLESENKKIYDRNLYVYDTLKNKISSNIDKILTIGDVVRIVTKSDEEYKDAMIIATNKDSITIAPNVVNTKTLETNKSILISDIVYINKNEPTDKLYYDYDMIKQDFILLMNAFDKEFFKENDLETVYNVYKDAIIDRTWMCRNEHILPILVDNTNNENVFLNVKNIIKDIKESL